MANKYGFEKNLHKFYEDFEFKKYELCKDEMGNFYLVELKFPHDFVKINSKKGKPIVPTQYIEITKEEAYHLLSPIRQKLDDVDILNFY